MKLIGVIGGIGPESTIDYYRALIAAHQERQPDGSYPAIVISSVDAGRCPPSTRSRTSRSSARCSAAVEYVVFGRADEIDVRIGLHPFAHRLGAGARLAGAAPRKDEPNDPVARGRRLLGPRLAGRSLAPAQGD